MNVFDWWMGRRRAKNEKVQETKERSSTLIESVTHSACQASVLRTPGVTDQLVNLLDAH
jgi:hypothetical protein